MDEITDFTSFVIDDTKYETKLSHKYSRRKPWKIADPKKIKAFIPGVILSISVKPGEKVKKGDTLLVLEAMKMHNVLKSNMDGNIKNVLVQQGDKVSKEQLLVEFE